MKIEDIRNKQAQWGLMNWDLDEACFSDEMCIFEMPISKVRWDSIGAFWGAFNPVHMEIYRTPPEDGEKEDVILVEMHFDHAMRVTQTGNSNEVARGDN